MRVLSSPTSRKPVTLSTVRQTGRVRFSTWKPKFSSYDTLVSDGFTVVPLIILSVTSQNHEIQLASVNIMKNPCLTF